MGTLTSTTPPTPLRMLLISLSPLLRVPSQTPTTKERHGWPSLPPPELLPSEKSSTPRRPRLTPGSETNLSGPRSSTTPTTRDTSSTPLPSRPARATTLLMPAWPLLSRMPLMPTPPFGISSTVKLPATALSTHRPPPLRELSTVTSKLPPPLLPLPSTHSSPLMPMPKRPPRTLTSMTSLEDGLTGLSTSGDTLATRAPSTPTTMTPSTTANSETDPTPSSTPVPADNTSTSDTRDTTDRTL